MSHCPCCGARVSRNRVMIEEDKRAFTINGKRVRLTPGPFKTALALVRAHPRTVATDILIDATYGTSEIEKPDLAINQSISRARACLKPLGIEIKCERSLGFYVILPAVKK